MAGRSVCEEVNTELRQDLARYCYIGLVHYPVYNKRKEVISTAVTNLDIHDLSRLARTYELAKFFIIGAQEFQKDIVAQIITHWTLGVGGRINPHRQEAFKKIAVVDSSEKAVEQIKADFPEVSPSLIGTGASVTGNLAFSGVLEKLKGRTPCLLLFGTGWGICYDQLKVDYLLPAISGVGDYNHLSVRSATAIILDRIFF